MEGCLADETHLRNKTNYRLSAEEKVEIGFYALKARYYITKKGKEGKIGSSEFH